MTCVADKRISFLLSVYLKMTQCLILKRSSLLGEVALKKFRILQAPPVHKRFGEWLVPPHPEILNRANVKLVCFFGLAVGSRSQEVERSEPTSAASA